MTFRAEQFVDAEQAATLLTWDAARWFSQAALQVAHKPLGSPPYREAMWAERDAAGSRFKVLEALTVEAERAVGPWFENNAANCSLAQAVTWILGRAVSLGAA